MDPAETTSAPPAREPWRTAGLVSLWTDRRLLWQLTRIQRAGRLRGTILGGLWDFINPLVQFSVYFFIIGKLLQLDKSVEEFPLYIFSGLVTVQVFISGLTGLTGTFTRNRGLVRRAVFPRELLPASRMLNEMMSLGPPIAILLVVAWLHGWYPDLNRLLLALAGMALLLVFTYGLGLVFGVANVFIRDTGQAVGVITTLARWGVPIIYPWTLVPETYGDGLLTTLYLANPVTVAVFAMREAFWMPTVEEGLPPLPLDSLIIGISATVLTLVLGLVLLHRYQFRVVQRLRWTT